MRVTTRPEEEPAPSLCCGSRPRSRSLAGPLPSSSHRMLLCVLGIRTLLLSADAGFYRHHEADLACCGTEDLCPALGAPSNAPQGEFAGDLYAHKAPSLTHRQQYALRSSRGRPRETRCAEGRPTSTLRAVLSSGIRDEVDTACLHGIPGPDLEKRAEMDPRTCGHEGMQ